MLSQIRAAWRAYSDGGFKEVVYRAANFHLAPPEWLGLIDIHEGDTVLELGGYHGDFARLAATKVGPSGQVITVEPHPENLEHLRKNCADFENVEIVEGAVTESGGEGRLWLSGNPAGHRMRREEKDSEIDESGFVSVETYTIDALCDEYGVEHIDFIKIDIEGGEIAALRGADRMLESTSRVMVEAYHGHPDPESEDRTCGPEVYRILHRHMFKTAVTEDYMVFGWRKQMDKSPLLRRILFTVFSGRYGNQSPASRY